MQHTLIIKWGTSRGRDTYGYNTCSLSENGHRRAACNGGGYDMLGTVFGHWLASTYRERLNALPASAFPPQSHWEPDHSAYICRACISERISAELEPVTLTHQGDEWPTCPECGEAMSRDNHAGQRIEDPPRLYGLTFHDPNYDPGQARIGKDCTDRTIGKGSGGKTVAEAEAAGESFGLERYQASYSASSPVPTERHTYPSIDGACGFSSVERIANALGLTVQLVDAGKKRDVIIVLEQEPTT